MATSAVSGFIEDPSVVRLEAARIEDLHGIADHYGLVVPKQARKAELLASVTDGLVEKGVLFEVREDSKTRASPSSPDRLSLVGLGSAASGSAKLRMRMVRLESELKEREQARLFEFELAKKRIDADVEVRVRIRQLEIEAGVGEAPSPSQTAQFDVCKNIALVPPFREAEVDSYFFAFERVAAALHWPRDVWPILIQCKLSGKAQEVVAALSLEDSLQYEIVKATVLRAYELVPEAYRQRFRNFKKPSNRSYVEFARDKESLFDRWCSASKATTFAGVRELTT